MRYVRYPGHLSETPASLHRHPPLLGEHNDEILAEAGYTTEEVTALREAGVVT
jgi:crotonobetainyl-CoA:carnitine CoA-transferase CaiB-like acyl-CoA transferase